MTTENNRVTEMNAKQFEEQTKVYGNEIKLDTVLHKMLLQQMVLARSHIKLL